MKKSKYIPPAEENPEIWDAYDPKIKPPQLSEEYLKKTLPPYLDAALKDSRSKD